MHKTLKRIISFTLSITISFAAMILSSSVSTFAVESKKILSSESSENLFGFDMKNQINYIAYSDVYKNGYRINTQKEYIDNCQHDYTSIKGDMRMTSDLKIVMCHDEGFTLDGDGKITTYDKTNSNGTNVLIRNMTYDECMALTYDDKYNSGVCDFETYISICKQYKKIPFITLRQDNTLILDPDDNIQKKAYIITIKKMLSVLDKYNMRKHCIINSTNYSPLWELRHHFDSTIPMAFSYGKIASSDNKLRIDQAANQLQGNCIVVGGIENDINNLDVKFDDGSGKKVSCVEYAESKGILFYCYFIGSKEDAKTVVDKGVMGMQMTCGMPDELYQPVIVKNIYIPQKPFKTTYITGEPFNSDGMQILATYTDGKISDVTDEVYLSGFNSSKTGLQIINASYTYNKKTVTLEFSYSVISKLRCITLVSKPSKLKYEYGESLSKDGICVIASFTDGTKKDVTNLIRTSGYSSKQPGLQIITVSYTYASQSAYTQFSVKMNKP